ncbi:uncharacterized protein [Aristolochia californica]|uniref:uncharacterized protein isoform X1 n=1 Tax=Aristolochia californica TaxID=171875 RepID=UPI0035E0BE68
MAESSAALCCSSFLTFPVISHSKQRQLHFPVTLYRPTCLSPSRAVQSRARESEGSDFFSEDPFDFYTWKYWNVEEGDGGIEWVPEERVTLFTTDGILQIGGSLLPCHISLSKRKRGKRKASQRSQRFQESDYMDPNRGLCLGALFDIAATNGLDMGRRLCFFGFCLSIEMLSDVVEDTVLDHGGEVVAIEKASDGGLQEKLTMTVIIPLLWGVPPASETLRFAVRSG